MPTPILLLHGAWHGAWRWTPVLIRLAGIPRTAVAVDMAGHGLHAPPPRSLYREAVSGACGANHGHHDHWVRLRLLSWT
jgi:pimeloyl-ACP methyl ester carboxylesterase